MASDLSETSYDTNFEDEIQGIKSSSDDERFNENLNFIQSDNLGLSGNSSSSSSPDSESQSFCEDAAAALCSSQLHDKTTSLCTSSRSLDQVTSEASSMVPLEPFVHQVGGHFPMVCLATETICKPLNDREHNFYRTLPHVLHPYTPKFEGIMSVALHEDENGYITLMGTPPNCYGLKQNRSLVRSLKSHQQMLLLHHHIQQEQLKDCFYGKKYPRQIRLKRTDSLEIERADSPAVSRSISVPGSIPASPKDQTKAGSATAESSSLSELLSETVAYATSQARYYFFATPEEIEEDKEKSSEPKEEIYCNPWALKCHRDHLKKLGLLSSAHSSHSGGSNSPTTCGNNATQLYLLLENLVSKYCRPCVLDLKVGSRQYADDVSAAKKQRKIAKSANTTSATLGLRLCGMQVYNVSTGKYLCHNKYYGRSLSPPSFKIAIAQFLNNSDQPEQLRVDVIEELLKKLNNLVQILQNLESFRFYTSSLLVTYDGAAKQSSLTDVEKTDAKSKDKKSKSFEKQSALDQKSTQTDREFDDRRAKSFDETEFDKKSRQNLVDVRIIDFAHSTHKGLKDATLHAGPDLGFIDGIQNFITILNEIKQQKRIEEKENNNQVRIKTT